jgi:hypothetical protein
VLWAAVVALTGVLIAQVVTLVNVRGQAAQTQRAWVLEQRRIAYEAVVVAASAFLAYGSGNGATDRRADLEGQRQLALAVHGLNLMASRRVGEVAEDLVNLMRDTYAKPEGDDAEFVKRVNALILAMAVDLIPADMR